MCEINKFALVVDPIRPNPPIISDSPSQIVDTTDNVLITEKKSTQDLAQISTQILICGEISDFYEK